MTEPARIVVRDVVGGVDTHSKTHHVAVLDYLGREVGDREFPATAAGYEALTGWLRGFGELSRVGVEGTSSYGAGLARHLRAAGVSDLVSARPRGGPGAASLPDDTCP
jgi:transposase